MADAQSDNDVTSSIAHSSRDNIDAAAKPSAGDLAYAKAAAVEVLAHGGKDNSVPWQNPETGAGGNITPLATAYTDAGLSCRNFLASYTHDGSQAWLQGAACHANGGKWEVKHLTPFSQS